MAVALGDPAAMRSEAYGLRAQAEALGSLAQHLHERAAATEFEGPAALRFRDAMSDKCRQVMQLSGELQDLANYVIRAAARVEDQIAAIQREEARRRELESAEEGW